jgi:GT2 family glycosyltransferase
MERGQLDCGASFTLVRQENGGPASARNTGARLAQGSLLVFTDDDCEPDEDWLTRVAAANRRAPEAALGGRCINGLADNSYSTASQMLIDYLYAYDGCGPEGARFFTSNNFAVPAASFAALGGFDTRFPKAAGEDRDFCERWRHAGKALLYVPDAVILHSHDLGLRRFWIQHRNYGRAAYRFHRGRAERLQQPLRVEPLRFYFGLISFPWGRASPPRALALSVLLFLSQLANAYGFFLERQTTSPG